MNLVALAINCPVCGASEITYTCEPKCCFNHVCNRCHTSFQLVTRKVGEFNPAAPAAGPELPPLPHDPLRPTTGCPRCESIRIFQIEEDAAEAGKLVCADCRALLELAFEDVEQN